MTVAEYRPVQRRQPDHLSDKPSFKSRALGRVVSTAGVPHLSIDDAIALRAEIEQATASIAVRMTSQAWPMGDYRRMKSKRTAWGVVYTHVQRHIGELRRSQGPDRKHVAARLLAEFFVDIAKETLPKEAFQQILDLAKARSSGGTPLTALPSAGGKLVPDQSRPC